MDNNKIKGSLIDYLSGDKSRTAYPRRKGDPEEAEHGGRNAPVRTVNDVLEAVYKYAAVGGGGPGATNTPSIPSELTLSKLDVNVSTTLSGTSTLNGTVIIPQGGGIENLVASKITTGTLPVARGGTGSSTAPTDNQIPVGVGGNYQPSDVVGSGSITVTHSPGVITIGSSAVGGVSSLTGTANQVNVSSSTGAVTLSLPQNIATSSTPTFGGATLTGGLQGTSGTFSGTLRVNSSGSLSLGSANGDRLVAWDGGTNNSIGLGVQAGNVNVFMPNFNRFSVRGGGTSSGAEVFTVQTPSGNTAISGTLAVTGAITGNLTGNASTTTVVADDTTNASQFVTFSNAASGNLSMRTDTALRYNPSTNTLTAGLFAGNGASLTNLNAANISAGTLSVVRGGTGSATTPTNGQLPIGNGTSYTPANITAGSGIGVVNGAGTITLNNSGVTSVTGTAAQVNVSAATGAVTFSLPQSIGTTSSVTFGQMSITGNMSYGGQTVIPLSRNVPITVGGTVDIGTFNIPANGTPQFEFTFNSQLANFALNKKYVVLGGFNPTGGVWRELIPTHSSGDWIGNDYTLDMMTTATTVSFRLRTVTMPWPAGTGVGGNVRVTGFYFSFTPSTTVTTGVASPGLLIGAGNLAGTVNGRLGIGTATPTVTCDVAGAGKFSGVVQSGGLTVNGETTCTRPSVNSFTPVATFGNSTSAARIVFGNAAYGDVPANKPFLHSYDNMYIGSDAGVSINFISGVQLRATIDAAGNLIQSAPATPPALIKNETMSFNLTSNTNLRVSVRGTDGVTRTANITLT